MARDLGCRWPAWALTVLLLLAAAPPFARAAVLDVDQPVPASADVYLIGLRPVGLEVGATLTVQLTTQVGASAPQCRPRRAEPNQGLHLDVVGDAAG